MRILGIPVVYHYVQFRFYFASKVVLPVVRKITVSKHPKRLEPLLFKLTMWGVGVMTKTLRWKLNKERSYG